MYLPLKIKFDKPSIQLGVKSYIIPLKEGADVLDTVEYWLSRPYLQEWFTGCKVVWIETIGDVELFIEDFA